MTTCVLTTSIAKGCRDSIGGIKTIYVAELSRKGSVTQASGVITAWTMASGTFWTYNLEVGVAQFTQKNTVNRTNGSNFIDQSITFTIPKQQASLAQELLLLSKNDLLIIALDRNGKYWLLGENNGMSITENSGETGTAFGDFNGYKLTATGMEASFGPEVTASLISSLAP